VSKVTWVLRALWTLLAVVLVLAILIGIIRGTFYTGPAPAPETTARPPDPAPGAPPSSPLFTPR